MKIDRIHHDAYWTVAQLVEHYTVNDCNLRAGEQEGFRRIGLGECRGTVLPASN